MLGNTQIRELVRNGQLIDCFDGLRLDHILYVPQTLELKKIDIPHSEVSDHYPVVCDFSMRT